MILTRLKESLYDRLPLSTKLSLKELAFRRDGSKTEIGDKPWVIVFDERIPTPDRDAGSLRMMRILSTLGERWEVIFVPFTNRGDQEHILTEAGVKVANVAEYRRLIHDPRAIAAIVSRPTMADLFTARIRRLNPRIRIIFDTVDVHFVRLQREYELTGDPATKADADLHRDAEARLAREADAIWCASADDELNIRQVVSGCDSVIVPTLHDLHDSGLSFEERAGLLFVGSFAHRPNADAVIYFLREIFPIVQRSMPDVTCHIVGADPPSEIMSHASESVHVHGYIPDLESILQSVRVFIAPLRYGGAGTKGKVGEALAHGLPVVCTSIGAEGFGLRSGVDAVIADEPEAFAEAVCQVHSGKELWTGLATHGRKRIEAEFTPAAVSAKIFASVEPEAFTGVITNS